MLFIRPQTLHTGNKYCDESENISHTKICNLVLKLNYYVAQKILPFSE
jgi:hypothetical protein